MLFVSYLFRGFNNLIRIQGGDYIAFLKSQDLLQPLIEKVKVFATRKADLNSVENLEQLTDLLKERVDLKGSISFQNRPLGEQEEVKESVRSFSNLYMSSDRLTDSKIGEMQYFFEKPVDQRDIKRGLYDNIEKLVPGSEQGRFDECVNDLVLH